jgi:hypothetical protein
VLDAPHAGQVDLRLERKLFLREAPLLTEAAGVMLRTVFCAAIERMPLRIGAETLLPVAQPPRVKGCSF